MTLVNQSLGVTAQPGSKFLYKHALVEHGTLQLVDFSNAGTLNNFSTESGNPVHNLASDSSKNLWGLGNGIISTNTPVALTEGMGFDGSSLLGAGPQGALFGDLLLKYLYNNPSHKYIFWFWTRAKSTGFVGGGLFRSYAGLIASYPDIRANISTSKMISPSLGGGNNGDLGIDATDGKSIQVGITFEGTGQTPKIFRNGAFIGRGTTVATGFGNLSTNIGIGKIEGAAAPTAPVYEWGIEDLTISGRTAEAVIQKDYNYVHAIGEFEGIQKRPWVDKY